MSDHEILKLKQSVQYELVEINLTLKNIKAELTEIKKLCDSTGRLGKAVKNARESFESLESILNIPDKKVSQDKTAGKEPVKK